MGISLVLSEKCFVLLIFWGSLSDVFIVLVCRSVRTVLHREVLAFLGGFSRMEIMGCGWGWCVFVLCTCMCCLSSVCVLTFPMLQNVLFQNQVNFYFIYYNVDLSDYFYNLDFSKMINHGS